MKKDLYHYPRLNATSIPHLEQLLIEYSNKHDGVNVLEIKIDVEYRQFVRDDYHCPLDVGTNVHLTDNLPSGYPVLFGNIYVKVLRDRDSNFHIGKFAGVNIGCAFGGSPNRIVLFLDDYPLIKQAVLDEQAKIQQAKEVATKLYDQYNLAVTQDNVIIDLDKNISHLTNEIAKLQKDLSNVYAHKSRYVLDVHKQPLYDMYSEYKQSVGNLVYMKDYPMLDF